jgi:hypothetical protein
MRSLETGESRGGGARSRGERRCWKSRVISAPDVVGPTPKIAQFSHAHPSGAGDSLQLDEET